MASMRRKRFAVRTTVGAGVKVGDGDGVERTTCAG